MESLLYDPVRRVCNWKSLVNCGATGVRKNKIFCLNKILKKKNFPLALVGSTCSSSTESTVLSTTTTRHWTAWWRVQSPVIHYTSTTKSTRIQWNRWILPRTSRIRHKWFPLHKSWLLLCSASTSLWKVFHLWKLPHPRSSMWRRHILGLCVQSVWLSRKIVLLLGRNGCSWNAPTDRRNCSADICDNDSTPARRLVM